MVFIKLHFQRASFDKVFKGNDWLQIMKIKNIKLKWMKGINILNWLIVCNCLKNILYCY